MYGKLFVHCISIFSFFPPLTPDTRHHSHSRYLLQTTDYGGGGREEEGGRRGGRAPYATKPDSRSVLFPSMDRECPVRSMPALPPKKTVHRNKKRLPFIAALQWLFLISSKMKSISHVEIT